MVALLRRCSLPPAATLLWTSGRADSLRCRRSIRTDKTVGVARGYPGGPLTTNGLVHAQGFVEQEVVKTIRSADGTGPTGLLMGS
jgi:hypothetical protein